MFFFSSVSQGHLSSMFVTSVGMHKSLKFTTSVPIIRIWVHEQLSPMLPSLDSILNVGQRWWGRQPPRAGRPIRGSIGRIHFVSLPSKAFQSWTRSPRLTGHGGGRAKGMLWGKVILTPNLGTSCRAPNNNKFQGPYTFTLPCFKFMIFQKKSEKNTCWSHLSMYHCNFSHQQLTWCEVGDPIHDTIRIAGHCHWFFATTK